MEDVTTLEGYYIRWEDVACKSGTGPNIPGDGTPFIILGNVSKECHQGPQRPHGLKWKQHEDHNQFVMGRRLVTPSKKQDCKAVVKIRTVLRFPSYKFEGNLSRWKRQEIASRIKREFTSSTPRELRVYVEMPNENDHSNHLTGELAGFVQNVDKSVIAKIHELVGEGVRNVAEMRRHLVTFVTKDVQPTVEYNIPPTNRRFYPTDRDIRNHINIAITQTSNCRTPDWKTMIFEDNNDLPPPTANPEVQDNNDLPPPTANPEVQDNNDLPPPTANPEVPDNNDLPPPTADNNDLPPPTANPEVQDNNDLPPPTADNNDLPPPTANPEVQDNNGLPGRADIATSNSAKDESSYCLREKKLKRKRSSFIYPSLSKKPGLYCKCQKPYDKKRFMVFCNGCGEWYHLDCLGLQEKDVPGRRIKFFCNDCQTATVKSSTPVESTDLSNTGGLDDHRMKTYLYNIMQCSETDCHIKEHKRHHTYVKAPFATHNKEKKRAGFGLDKFDQQFIEDYTEKLVNSLTVNKLKNPSKPYTGGSYITIKDLEAESVLWKIFYDKGLLATSYIIDVLAKKALIFIYMKKQKCKYEDANADLVKSEFHF